MTTFSERQFFPLRMLLCIGDIPHGAPMPRVHTDGATGDVRCEECGEPMALVDVITVDRHPTWAQLAYDRGAPLYTTARLLPAAILSRIAASSSATGEGA